MNSLAALLVLALPAPITQVIAVQETKLVAGDGQPFDQFGQSVAISGGTALVGASAGGSAANPNTGSAYVWVRSGMTWTAEAELLPTQPNNTPGSFGASVSLSGNTAVVGSQSDNTLGFVTGAVEVFVRSGTVWSHQQKLTASNASDFSAFGTAVDIDGNTLVVGALTDEVPSDSGSVYVFVRNGTIWTEQARVFASDPAAFARFGKAVSISGNTLVTGAPDFNSAGGAQSGAVYVHVRSGTTWSFQARLSNPNGMQNDFFGQSVAVSGDTLVVGELGGDGNGNGTGVAYVYVRSGTVWTQQAVLKAADGTPNALEQFGYSVALDGDLAAVGALLAYGAGGQKPGAAYAFRRSGTTWSKSSKFLARDGAGTAGGDWFGNAIDLSGSLVIVGAVKDDDVGQDAGTAWTYDLQPPAYYCTAKVNSCGTLPTIVASGMPSATAKVGMEITITNAKAGKANLLLYSDAGPGNFPFHGGILCLTPPVRRTPSVFPPGTAGLCDGMWSIDMNQFAAGLGGGNPAPSLSLPGTVVHCQWWGRDTVANGAMLSNAVTYTVGP